MKLFNKVRGSMVTVPNIEVNKDTVYIRSNIIVINEDNFKGWEYDEIQYDKDEYTEVTNEVQELLGKEQVRQGSRVDLIEADSMAFQEYVSETLGGM